MNPEVPGKPPLAVAGRAARTPSRFGARDPSRMARTARGEISRIGMGADGASRQRRTRRVVRVLALALMRLL